MSLYAILALVCLCAALGLGIIPPLLNAKWRDGLGREAQVRKAVDKMNKIAKKVGAYSVICYISVDNDVLMVFGSDHRAVESIESIINAATEDQATPGDTPQNERAPTQ